MSLSGEAVLYASSPCDKKAQESARRERRRRKILTELFTTERTYLHHLELVNKFFDFPLKFACLVPDDIHSRLFSNLEQIRDVNTTLLHQMEESSIGQAFCQLGPFLKLYATYANNHQYALSTLQEWHSKSQEFADFVSKQEDRPEVGGLKLNALLITPVQRIPRYKMLLEELLHCTPEDHYDYHKLEEASIKIGEIALHINEYIRQNENFMKMLAIQRSFDSSMPKLLVPGREFIKEGPLKKVSRKGGRSYERMFFLFTDVILYGKPKLLDGGGKSYTCSCVLPLRHCQVEPVFITNLKKADTGGVFKITCKDESLVLYSDDHSNAKDWSTAVETAIRKLCNERQTLRRPSSNKIPLRGRSLRRHRQQQKKSDLKVPGRTPLRPISQTSNGPDDNAACCSPELKARLYSVRSRALTVFKSNSKITPPKEEAGELEPKSFDMNSCHVSDHDIISLSDTSDSPSDNSRCKTTSQSSYESDWLHHENDCDPTNENLHHVTEESDLTVQSSSSKKGEFSGNNYESDSTSEDISRRQSVYSNDGEYDLDIPEENISTACLSNSGPYFPPNSPAHKYFRKKSWNVKLKSYFQGPLKRFHKAKKDISSPCSPFRSKFASGKQNGSS